MLSTIVILNDFAAVNGGSSQVALKTALGLAGKGYRVILFSTVGPIEPLIRTIPDLEIIHLSQEEIVSDPNRVRAFVNGLWNIKAQNAFSALLKDLDPQKTVIHLHGWTKGLSSSPVYAALQRSFPIVSTIHDYFFACPNGGFYNYQKNQPCPLVPLSRECILEHCDARSYPHKLWRVARQYTQRRFGGMPDQLRYFIYLTSFSYQILKPYLPQEGVFWQVDNPVDILQKPRVQAASNKTILYIGRLSKEKGPVLLAEAARNTHSPVRFVGDGPESEAVRNANPQAEITGWVPFEKVLDYLEDARCLVLPSVCYEVYPMVILEAAARGIPAVVPCDTAPSTLVVPDVTGMIFKRGDIADLTRHLEMIKEPGLIDFLSKNAYERYWANPSTMDQYIARLIDIYEKILVSFSKGT